MRANVRLVSQLMDWFQKNQRDLPWRRTRDPYAVWVSEIMLQQTQVKTVIPYWERWMRELPTIAALADAPEERILKLWEGLGYYSRARNLQKAARLIVEKHGGIFPREFGAVLELPGIGRYTAGAIASIAFGEAAPIVDGNVIRVLTRFFGIRGDPKGKETNAFLWKLAGDLVKATEDCSALNQGLMELGALICLPREPRCDVCPIRLRCFARRNSMTETLPESAPRPKTEERIFRAFLARRNESILLRRRKENVVNSGFWELPNVERKTPGKYGVLCVVKHSITRYRMTLEVVAAESLESGGEWVAMTDLAALPLVNAHRKALEKLGLVAPLKA
jgi:A/G-specific adenine glycosylase